MDSVRLQIPVMIHDVPQDVVLEDSPLGTSLSVLECMPGVAASSVVHEARRGGAYFSGGTSG